MPITFRTEGDCIGEATEIARCMNWTSVDEDLMRRWDQDTCPVVTIGKFGARPRTEDR